MAGPKDGYDAPRPAPTHMTPIDSDRRIMANQIVILDALQAILLETPRTAAQLFNACVEQGTLTRTYLTLPEA